MSAKAGDSAVLNLGEIGEEGLMFTSSSTSGGGGAAAAVQTHTFEGQVPDSALDADDDQDADDKAGLLEQDRSQQESVQEQRRILTYYETLGKTSYKVAQ